jgi:hypothetical protein
VTPDPADAIFGPPHGARRSSTPPAAGRGREPGEEG